MAISGASIAAVKVHELKFCFYAFHRLLKPYRFHGKLFSMANMAASTCGRRIRIYYYLHAWVFSWG